MFLVVALMFSPAILAIAVAAYNGRAANKRIQECIEWSDMPLVMPADAEIDVDARGQETYFVSEGSV